MAILLAASLASAGEYRWPLNGARKLSSSFGEFREGHYHAGIDLRTFGLIGLPCIALDTCDLVRLRVSPRGYGKAAYFRLADGTVAVYAHLNGFSRALDSLSYYWRLAHRTSSFDLEIAPGTYRFLPGDTVSYTGATGATQPHLHFEVRDAAGKPFNPLESMFRVPDACPPVISALEAVPIGWGSLVNGSPVASSRRFRLVKGGLYVLADTLQLDGTFGFGVSVYDKQVRGSYRMAPYSMELAIDGIRCYAIRNSSLDYSLIGDVPLEYEEHEGDVPGRYVMLFKKPANRLAGRDGIGIVTFDSARSDARALPAGVHRGEIAVRDAAGNEARAVFHFAMHRYPVVELSRGGTPLSRIEIVSFDPDGGTVSTALSVSMDEGKTWNPVALSSSSNRIQAEAVPADGALYRCIARDDEGMAVERYAAFSEPRVNGDSVLCECRPEVRPDGIHLRLRTNHPLASVPTVRCAGGRGGDSLRVVPVGAREYVAFAPVELLSSGVTIFVIRGMDCRGFKLERALAYHLYVLESGGGASFNAADTVAIRLKAPFTRGRSVLIIREAEDPGATSTELIPLARPFVLDFSLERYARGFLCDVSGNAQAGLFRWSGRRGGWRCVGVPARENDMVAVSRAGTYAVFADTTAPKLKELSRVRSNPGSGFFRNTLYCVPVRDAGTGIDAESATALLDGERVVCEWDEQRKRLAIPIPKAYPPGPARLRIELSDRAGNGSVGEYVFVID